VVLLDRNDRRSTAFTDVYVNADGALVLRGDMLLPPPGTVTHELRERPAADLIHPAEGGLDFVRRRSFGERRNLVVVRAGPGSLHAGWTRDLLDADRSWDLCVSWYGETESFGQDTIADFQILQNVERKYEAIHRLFQAGSPLWAYDRIALLDDDLHADWSGINRLFAIHREFDLQLAQPSLRPDVNVVHKITATDLRYLLRFTSFVESMAPVFTRAALWACIPTYANAGLGFGIDNIWPRLLGDPLNGVAVVDDVQVVHTRPMAINYVHWDALQEGSLTQVRYEASSLVAEYGGILREPIPRQT